MKIWYPLEKEISGGYQGKRFMKMLKRFEIYFDDLNPEAQKRLLKEFQTTPEEENWDVFPIDVIEREFVEGDNE